MYGSIATTVAIIGLVILLGVILHDQLIEAKAYIKDKPLSVWKRSELSIHWSIGHYTDYLEMYLYYIVSAFGIVIASMLWPIALPVGIAYGS